MNRTNYVKDRVALLVDVMHLSEAFSDSAALRQSNDALDLVDRGRVAYMQDCLVSDSLT